MILNMMIHFNTKIKCFTQPFFTDVQPEQVAIQESRSIQICEDGQKILPYKFLKLYCVGQFNDETGDFIFIDEEGNELKKELLDCRGIVKQRLEELGWSKKIDKDGIVQNA